MPCVEPGADPDSLQSIVCVLTDRLVFRFGRMVSVMSSELFGEEWIGRVIEGRFILQRWLGGSGQSSVFLTQVDGNELQNAAIKLISADAADAQACAAQWAAASQLSHPHIVRLFHAGRCSIDGHDLLYNVTEYSEEILAEILASRALTPAEAREMLDPVLGTLSWLHIHGFVHGGLKPSNIMVVDDRLKLSVDRVQAAGPRGASFPASGIYDAPGSADKISPAADVWSLGVLLVEALTQHPPQWDAAAEADPEIPPSIPEPFASIARGCLRVDPARRCTLSEIMSQLAPVPASPQPASASPAAAASRPPAKSPLPPVPPQQPPVKRTPQLPKSEPLPALKVAQPSAKIAARSRNTQSETIFATAALILIAAIAAVTFIPVHPHRPAKHSAPAAPSGSEPATPQSPATAAPGGPAIHGAVLHRVLPDVPQNALNTVRGHFGVGVRVQVDSDGNVSSATLDSPGPSHYFAERALDAARQWHFRPAQVGGQPVSSTWLLQFEFARSGTSVTPEETAP